MCCSRKQHNDSSGAPISDQSQVEHSTIESLCSPKGFGQYVDQRLLTIDMSQELSYQFPL